jgi:hypothetical protein
MIPSSLRRRIDSSLERGTGYPEISRRFHNFILTHDEISIKPQTSLNKLKINDFCTKSLFRNVILEWLPLLLLFRLLHGYFSDALQDLDSGLSGFPHVL